MVGRDDADNVELDLNLEDEASRFGLIPRGEGDHAIALRLSARVKDPLQGFTFGRNTNRCDICFVNDPLRRLSNIHFRVYLNEYGVLMLEDRSTNGTIVDEKLLKARAREASETKRTLSSGSTVKVLMHTGSNDLTFLVRIPRREGEYEAAYRANLTRHMRELRDLAEKANATIGPGPGGHVCLYQRPFTRPMPLSFFSDRKPRSTSSLPSFGTHQSLLLRNSLYQKGRPKTMPSILIGRGTVQTSTIG